MVRKRKESDKQDETKKRGRPRKSNNISMRDSSKGKSPTSMDPELFARNKNIKNVDKTNQQLMDEMKKFQNKTKEIQ